MGARAVVIVPAFIVLVIVVIVLLVGWIGGYAKTDGGTSLSSATVGCSTTTGSGK